MQNESIYLKSPKSKYLISLVSSLVFSALSVKLIMISGSLIPIILVILFVLSAAASLIALLPNQSYLVIEKAGITVRSMFKTIKIGWNEVEQFYADKKNSKDVVVFHLSEKRRTYLNLENLAGKHEVLPDNYGMDARELAELLEYHRIRYHFDNQEVLNLEFS